MSSSIKAFPSFSERWPDLPADPEGEEKEGDQLGRKGLGGGHTDLRTGMGIDDVVRVPGQA